MEGDGGRPTDEKGMDRRKFLKLVGAAGGSLVLGSLAAACGGAPAPTPTTAPKPAAPPPPAAKAAPPPAAPKPGVDMEAILEAAKKEGRVMLYTTAPTEGPQGLVAAFEKKYGIKAEFFRTPSLKLAQKLDAERKAGQMQADVLGFSERGMTEEFVKKGDFAPFEAPEAANYAPEFHTPHWTVGGFFISSIMYNTNLVKGEDVPKGWPDLANPKWRGKVGLGDPSATVQTVQWYWLMRKTYGVDFLKKVGQQKVTLSDGYGPLSQAVAAGELAISFMLNYRTYQMKEQGAPVEHIYPSPNWYNPRDFGVLAKAPHPNAGRLLYNFLLSQEGQLAFNGPLKSMSARPDVKIPGPPTLAELKKMGVELVSIPSEELFATQEEYLEEFKRFFGL